MSMPDGRLSCTACDYRGFMVFRRITLAYHFADGAKVDAPRDIRWCSDCGNPRDTESSNQRLNPYRPNWTDSTLLLGPRAFGSSDGSPDYSV